MKKTLSFAAILLILTSAFTCGKEDEKIKWVEAVILDLGDPSVDGCGWAVKINNTINIPEYLDEQYKQNELKAMIVYEETTQIYQCPGFSDVKYNKIIITQIKKIEL
jgi:hypothetical protein